MADVTQEWLAVMETLPTAVLFVTTAGEIRRQNRAAQRLSERFASWPPRLPSSDSNASRWQVWCDGQLLQVQTIAAEQGTWMTLHPLPAPTSGPLDLVTDSAGTVLYQGPGISKMGLQFVGLSLLAQLDEVEREDVELALEDGHSEELILIFRDQRGRQRQLVATLEDRRNDPSVLGMLLVCTEGTQLHALENQVRELERRYLRLLEGIPTAVVVDDPDGRTQYANSRARALLEEMGVAMQEASHWLRRAGNARLVGTTDRYPTNQLPSVRALRGEVCTIDDLEVVHNNQSTVLEISAAPVKNRGGGILYVVTSMRAITERRRQAQQAQQVQRLDAAGQLAGEIAHDFNNFLHAIGSFGRLALDSLDTAHPAHGDVEEVLQIAERASGLTRQLLTVSRRQPMTIQPISLNVLLINHSSLLNQMSGDKVDVEISTDPALWMVHADPNMLERVLINLVVNARDAMPDGGRINIRTEKALISPELAASIPEASPGAYGVLVVRDSGSGMPPETLSRIFEPFYTTKKPGKGTGLGLSMAYGAIRQMGGFIQVNSRPGEGTVFRIALKHMGSTTAPATLVDIPHDESPKPQVLVVDANPQSRQRLKDTLQRQGMTVLALGSSKTALNVVKSQPGRFGIWVLDLATESWSGVDLAHDLAALYPKTPCLFLADSLPPGRIPGRLLSKPFSDAMLCDMVRRMLRDAIVGASSG